MNNPPDILKKIVARKHEEIAVRLAAVSEEALRERLDTADAPRGFVRALRSKVDAGQAAVIAQVDEDQPTMVAAPVYPAAQRNMLSDVVFA